MVINNWTRVQVLKVNFVRKKILYSFFYYFVGRTTLPQSASYSITKYGVEAFSDALRREMRPWGVQVSIIEPGLFKTPLSDAECNIHSLQGLWDALSPDLKQEYGENRLENSKIIRYHLF